MINYKVFLLLLVLCGGWCSFCTVEKDTDDLESTILKVVKAFREKDAGTVNGLICAELGLQIIHRPGAHDYYRSVDKIYFKEPDPNFMPDFDLPDDYRLQFDTLPTFSCDDYSWSKLGLFCDTTAVNRLYSRILQSINRYDLGHVPESDIEAWKAIEDKSKRVIFSAPDFNSLIFHLTWIDGQWRLSMLDLLTDDCST